MQTVARFAEMFQNLAHDGYAEYKIKPVLIRQEKIACNFPTCLFDHKEEVMTMQIPVQPKKSFEDWLSEQRLKVDSDTKVLLEKAYLAGQKTIDFGVDRG